MKKNSFFKSFASIAVAMALCISTIPLYASAASPEPGATVENETIVFYNLDCLDVGESITQEITDQEGKPATITLQRLQAKVSSTGAASWKVTLSSTLINAEFYVDVVNNKIVKARNYSIQTIGATYENVRIEQNATTARLSFDVTSAGLMKSTCWLQATVRGYNNEVNVTHSI